MSKPEGGRRILDVTLRAQSDAVREVLGLARPVLAQGGLSEESCGRAEIVLAEALNNIVEHAYCDTATGDIRLLLDLSEAHLTMTLIDSGRGLTGADLPEGCCPCLGETRQSTPEGGFGWFLIRSLSEGIDFCRRDGRNRLTLRLARETGDDADQTRG